MYQIAQSKKVWKQYDTQTHSMASNISAEYNYLTIPSSYGFHSELKVAL